jgi:hypothetical protein
LGLSGPDRARLVGGPGHLPGERGVAIKLLPSNAFNPFHLLQSRDWVSTLPLRIVPK